MIQRQIGSVQHEAFLLLHDVFCSLDMGQHVEDQCGHPK